MKKLIFVLAAFFLFGVSINAQTNTATDNQTKTADAAKPKKQSFRAKKEILNNHS